MDNISSIVLLKKHLTQKNAMKRFEANNHSKWRHKAEIEFFILMQPCIAEGV